jgi:hypothetical protein
MTSRLMQFGIALAVCSCLFLPACNQEKEGGGRGGAVSHNVTIKIDNNNYCTQSTDGVNFAASPIPVAYGDSVTFQGPSVGTAFTVTFPSTSPCGSPFQSGACTTSFSNSAPTGTVASSMTFPYASVTIGTPSVSCNNPGSLGLIMR